MPNLIKIKGFTLIELLVVMSIVALLTSLVGPLAINSVDKANAKQEMLTLKNWLRKISYRAFATGNSYQLQLRGKRAQLFVNNEGVNNEGVNNNDETNNTTSNLIQQPIITHTFDTLFFQPQQLTYTAKGFVSPVFIEGTYRGKPLQLSLNEWVNGKEPIKVELIDEQ
jgi:prepilin-type N-terminal cleavage/methylation domain-containing protein